jgi:arginine N-succinyltransferase
MVLIRPAAMSDLEGLLSLANLAGVGLTTLPKDRALLARRIDHSVASFQKFAERPGGESYLFVMENLDSDHGATTRTPVSERSEDPDLTASSRPPRLIGACGIVSKVGGFEPFYGYHVETQLFESKTIGVHKEVPILKLVEEHDGPCEIGSLFLHPDFRGGGNGRMLQLVRFLFMAEHPGLFEPTVLSEIRGQLDDAGHSPFWDALGRHFFGIDFAEADRLSVVNKKFIAELMPDHPIYIPLLPADAQAVIGKPHRDSERAVRNLEAVGFTFSGMVDIFDAGPVLAAQRDQIRTVRMSRRATVSAIVYDEIGGPVFMVGTTTEQFRAVKTPVEQRGGGKVRLPADAARALQIHVGDPVRIVELYPS